MELYNRRTVSMFDLKIQVGLFMDLFEGMV
jgi:hypothetical protein